MGFGGLGQDKTEHGIRIVGNRTVLQKCRARRNAFGGVAFLINMQNDRSNDGQAPVVRIVDGMQLRYVIALREPFPVDLDMGIAGNGAPQRIANGISRVVAPTALNWIRRRSCLNTAKRWRSPRQRQTG